MNAGSVDRDDSSDAPRRGPEDAGTERAPGDGGGGLRKRLRGWRSPRRPRVWFELVLIAVSYWVYSLIRNAVPEQVQAAQEHAQWIWDVQESMGLAFELAVNHAVNDVTWLIVVLNYFYATLHFVVTIAVLVWLFRSHPGRYGATRLVLFATTVVALVGYYFYPLAPPRLMDGMDFVDTGLVHNTWGSLSSESMQTVSNQYAAMPSMHIGWALWCGVTIVVLARPLWLRVLGGLYPVATLFVIVATANHFWLDAVGGLLCLAFGYLVAWAWYGRSCYRLPRRMAGMAEPAAPVAGPSGATEGRAEAAVRSEPTADHPGAPGSAADPGTGGGSVPEDGPDTADDPGTADGPAAGEGPDQTESPQPADAATAPGSAARSTLGATALVRAEKRHRR